MPPPLSRGGFGIPESFTVSPEAPLLGATATTAASGGNREELLGQRPAGCKRQRSRLRGWTKENLPHGKAAIERLKLRQQKAIMG